MRCLVRSIGCMSASYAQLREDDAVRDQIEWDQRARNERPRQCLHGCRTRAGVDQRQWRTIGRDHTEGDCCQEIERAEGIPQPDSAIARRIWPRRQCHDRHSQEPSDDIAPTGRLRKRTAEATRPGQEDEEEPKRPRNVDPDQDLQRHAQQRGAHGGKEESRGAGDKQRDCDEGADPRKRQARVSKYAGSGDRRRQADPRAGDDDNRQTRCSGYCKLVRKGVDKRTT